MNFSDFVFVTGNPGKLAEVRAILGNHIETHDTDLEEIQGSAQQIIIAKAKLAARLLNRTVLVEDVSLNFDALNGLPGPYIKPFVKKLGATGIFELLKNYENKNAQAHCRMALCAPNHEPLIVDGVCAGTIVPPREGNEGAFGFDPIFLPDGETQVYAEMPSEKKNAISHRGRALALLKEKLAQQQQSAAAEQ